jgi:hypothetical protein
VLTWVALALFAAALVVAARWGLHQRDGLGRARPFPLVSVLVLTCLAGGLLVPVIRHHRLETRLSAVATTLVGAPSVVHCQTAGGEMVDLGPELGFVRWGPGGVPEHQTLIKRAPCKQLAAYLHGDQAHPSEDEVVAVHVLSHESRHMAGITDEALADCSAMQRDAWTARLLGASPEEASRLALFYWRVDYPRMPEAYVSSDCGPGKSLDEHLAEPPWTPNG